MKQKIASEAEKYSLPPHVLEIGKNYFPFLSRILLEATSEYVLVCLDDVVLPEDISERVAVVIARANRAYGSGNWGVVGNSGIEFLSEKLRSWMKGSDMVSIPSPTHCPILATSLGENSLLLNVVALKRNGVSLPSPSNLDCLHGLILSIECYRKGLICLIDSGLFASHKNIREPILPPEAAQWDWFRQYWRERFINHRLLTTFGSVDIAQDTGYLMLAGGNRREDFYDLVESVAFGSCTNVEKTITILTRTQLKRIGKLKRLLDSVRMGGSFLRGNTRLEVFLSVNGVGRDFADEQIEILKKEYSDLKISSVFSEETVDYYPRVRAIKSVVDTLDETADAYIWIVDDDDFIFSPAVRYLSIFLDERAILVGDSEVFLEKWSGDASIPEASVKYKKFDGSLYADCFSGENYVPVCSSIYPLRVIKQVFDELGMKGDYLEDYTLFLFSMSRVDVRHVPVSIAGISFHGENTVLENDRTHWEYSYATNMAEVVEKGLFRSWQSDFFGEKEQIINQKEQIINQKEQIINQKEQNISRLDQEIQQKKQEISNLHQVIQRKDEEFSHVVNSFRWKIPNYFYKLYKNRIKRYIPRWFFRIMNPFIDVSRRTIRFTRKYLELARLAFVEYQINGFAGLRFAIKRHMKKRRGELLVPYATVNDYEKGLITIGILSKDRLELIRPCIESIERNLSKKYRVEILIGDTGSTDKSVWSFYRKVRSIYKNIRVVKFREYFFSKNYNDMFRTGARGEYVVFLNNDTVVKPGWLDNLIDPLEDKRVGIVGGKLLYADETVQHAGVEFDENGNGVHTFSKGDKNLKEISYKAITPSVTFACVAVRHDVYNRFLLSEEFREEAQDTDFCFRLNEAGFQVLYNPDVEIYHLEGSSRDWRKGELDRVLFREKWGEKVEQYLSDIGHQRKRFDENAYEGAIVVVRDDGIGDLLMGVSAFTNLRRQYPDKKLVLLAYERNVEVMAGFGIFDEILPIPNGKKYSPLPLPTRGTTVYDLVDLEMQFGPIHAKSKEANKVPRQVSFARAIGVSEEYVHVPMPEYPEAKEKVLGLIREAGAHEDDTFVVFNLLATNPARSWWYPYYPALIAAVEAMGFVPLVVGVQDSEHFQGKRVINLNGKTKTIAEYIEAVKLGSYVISTDTSACHVAALADIPFLAIFTGGVPPEARLQFYTRYEALEPSGLACYPCWDEGCKDPAIRWKKDPCRLLITPKMTIEKFKKLVEAYPMR